MRYDDPRLREHLASAYALGALHGGARRRFERLLIEDADLRALVVARQEDFVPLALGAPEVAPPARVRHALATAIGAAPRPRARPTFWQGVKVWRMLALANGVVAACLVAVIGLRLFSPMSDPAMASRLVYVGVLNDPSEAPTVAIMAYDHPFRLEIESRTPLTVSPGEVLRLWLRPADGAPVFVAALSAGEKRLTLDEAGWRILRQAKRLVISRESASAAPDLAAGVVLYEGVCINVKQWGEPKASSSAPSR
jgi:anti-sigma-K factor RskA